MEFKFSGWTTAGEGALEGELICVSEAAAGGEAVCDAGGGDVQGGEDFCEVICRCLAFDIGAEGQYDFRRIFFANPLQKGLDAELRGADVVQRGKAAAECVVKTLKDAAALEREDVGGLLDDADFLPLARGLEADFAKFRDGEEAAFFAGVDR